MIKCASSKNKNIDWLCFDGLRINLQCSVEKTRQPEGGIRLVVMAGESIYANVRLRLVANLTNGIKF